MDLPTSTSPLLAPTEAPSESPTNSQNTSMMIFADKPKKAGSLLVKNKRTISLLNADYKLITGIEASRHRDIMDRTISKNQFAVGKNRNIRPL